MFRENESLHFTQNERFFCCCYSLVWYGMVRTFIKRNAIELTIFVVANTWMKRAHAVDGEQKKLDFFRWIFPRTRFHEFKLNPTVFFLKSTPHGHPCLHQKPKRTKKNVLMAKKNGQEYVKQLVYQVYAKWAADKHFHGPISINVPRLHINIFAYFPKKKCDEILCLIVEKYTFGDFMFGKMQTKICDANHAKVHLVGLPTFLPCKFKRQKNSLTNRWIQNCIKFGSISDEFSWKCKHELAFCYA